jgi:hypothetical protein
MLILFQESGIMNELCKGEGVSATLFQGKYKGVPVTLHSSLLITMFLLDGRSCYQHTPAYTWDSSSKIIPLVYLRKMGI